MRRHAAFALGFLVLAAGPGAGHAEAQERGSVRVGAAAARAGAAAVRVPIFATTDRRLTLLNLEVAFDRALCRVLEGQAIRKAGRSVQDPQEGGIKCPAEGKISVVIVDFLGGDALPAGEGPIAEWTFNVKPSAAGGVFPLTLRVIQANNGPVPVTLSAFDGRLTIERSRASARGTPRRHRRGTALE